MSDNQALEIKGTMISTLDVHLYSDNLSEIDAFLTQKFGERATFFEGKTAVIDLDKVPHFNQIDEVITRFRNLGIIPIAVRHGIPEQNKIATCLFLACLNPKEEAAGTPESSKETPPSETVIAITDEQKANSEEDALPLPKGIKTNAKKATIKKKSTADITQAAIPFEPEKPASVIMDKPAKLPQKVAVIDQPPSEKGHRPAQILSKPLRSGQQFYAKDSDLIVLAPVSFGAEIIADGNIHVYSTLRGRALAGVLGDRSARIFALSMNAELVAIAGVYRTFEDALPDILSKQPVQVILKENDQIIVELINKP